MHEFRHLLDSTLTITWTTLKFGWQELNVVTKPDLIAWAMDQIGYCPDEQSERVCELAFADETDTWTISRCLDELASNQPEELMYAKRAWRWVMLDACTTEFDEYLAKSAEAFPISVGDG